VNAYTMSRYLRILGLRSYALGRAMRYWAEHGPDATLKAFVRGEFA
jgi:hypothetical protein